MTASSAQQRMWFLDRLMPGNPSYNCPMVQRVRGTFDPARFAGALETVVARHEVLRTVLTEVDGVPKQLVREQTDPGPRVVDAADEEAARELVRAEVAEPFDLAAGPLFRALVVRLAEDDHVICLVLHHACVDGWSLGLLTAELSTVYAALGEGAEPRLPELPVQYADFAGWEAQRLQGRRLKRQTDYWVRRLSGMPATLELRTDRPRPSSPSHRADLLRFTVPPELTRPARELSAAEGTTLYMTLLAVLNLVLAKHASTSDVAIGSPILNRTRAELEPLLGFFANTLVFRTDVGGDPTFRELLGRVREATTGAYNHSELPFENIVEALNIERDLSHNPLVQLLFQLTSAAPGQLRAPGAQVAEFEYDLIFTRMDLEFHLAEEPGGEELTGSVVFSTELFDRASVELLVHHFLVGLAQALARPDAPISAVTLLDGAERGKLIEDWAGPATAPAEAPLHELFAAQAARTPDSVALVSAKETLTYQELQTRANRLAHRLRELGAGPGELVGLCVGRGTGIVEGMIGVLASGAAYVPIDPGLPAERIAFILADTGLSRIVADAGTEGLFAGFAGQLVRVDRPELFAELPASAPEAGTGPRDLAYVIYTSGSTGRPKGILMPHEPIVNLVRWQKTVMPATEETRTAQFSALGFDISLQEVFSALLYGESVHIPPEQMRRDAAAFVRWLAEHRINQVFLPNVMVQALSEEVDRTGADLPELRQLSQAGDRFSLDAPLRRLVRRHPDLRVHNHYGPSEAHVITGYSFPADESAWPESAPVGRPVANTRLYVVDSDLRPVPTGVPGELCVSGAGLGLGYLGRPELTDELFVPNPFHGGRMYRTGDLVRWRWDGNLEFLGRIDHQVKVRGFRIEPGEIETVLEAHRLVRQAVVVAVDTADGGKRLVGYVTVTPDGETGIDLPVVLREHVAASLPEYMVPSAFVVLDRLPVTAGGKVDRTQLPEPQLRGALDVAYVPPRTLVERQVCETFAGLLDVPSVGVDDDFFALGGHSLIAARIVARVRELAGVDLPLRAVFDARTPARIAALIAQQHADAEPALVRLGHEDPVPVSLSQRNLVVGGCRPGQESRYVVMPIVQRLAGRLDLDVLHAALDLVVQRHSAVRTTFTEATGGVVSQRVHPGGIELSRVDLTGAPDEVAERVAAEIDRPFDISVAGLLRATLFQLAPDEHVLCLVQHHITSDGWSQGVLLRELSTAYSAMLHGDEPALPALPVQYRDFAAWEQTLADSGKFDEHRDYWAQRLKEMRPVLLPTDRPRGGASGSGRVLRAELPGATVSAARELATANGASLFMVLLAAFKTVLHARTGARELSVGVPVANRTRVEVENLIGSFAKVIATGAEVDPGQGFLVFLNRVREGLLASTAHQDLPLLVAMAELDPARDLAAERPLPVLFQLVDTPSARLELPGVEASEFEFDVRFRTPVDLEVHLVAGAGGALVAHAVFDEDLFDATTVRGLLEATTRVLAAATAEPASTMAELAGLANTSGEV